MREIKVSRGNIALVDDEDYDFLNQWKWSLLPNRNNNYAIRGEKKNGRHKTILMHREILRYHDTINIIDHIDRNGLNNQRSNLRIVTQLENLRNSRDRIWKGKLGLKKMKDKWVLYFINHLGVKILNSFDDQKTALIDIRQNRKSYLKSI